MKIETKNKYVISYICRIAEQKRPFLLLEINERKKYFKSILDIIGMT